MHLGQLDLISQIKEQSVNFRAPNDTYMRAIGFFQRLPCIMRHLCAVFFPCGITGEHDVAAALQYTWQAIKGFPAHYHRSTFGNLFEMAKVGGDMPRQIATCPDNAIAGTGDDKNDFRVDHKIPTNAEIGWLQAAL